jgi:hypothetical protein
MDSKKERSISLPGPAFGHVIETRGGPVVAPAYSPSGSILAVAYRVGSAGL